MVRPRLLSGRIFGIGGQVVAAARPARARTPEDARLRLDGRVVVERTGRDDHRIDFLHVARYPAAAIRAKAVAEALRLRDLVQLDQFLALEPVDRSGLEKQIGGMPGAGGLAAALAVAVVKLDRRAADFVLHGAAETTTAKGGWYHLMILSGWEVALDDKI